MHFHTLSVTWWTGEQLALRSLLFVEVQRESNAVRIDARESMIKRKQLALRSLFYRSAVKSVRTKKRTVRKCNFNGKRVFYSTKSLLDSIKTYSLESMRHYLIKMLAKANETTLRLMVQIPWHITQASGIVHTQNG